MGRLALSLVLGVSTWRIATSLASRASSFMVTNLQKGMEGVSGVLF